MTEQDIVDRVKGLYPDALIDVAGADCNFEMYIVSDALQGMGLLQRQQSILGLFKDELASGKLHALSIKAKTQKEQAGGSSLLQIKV